MAHSSVKSRMTNILDAIITRLDSRCKRRQCAEGRPGDPSFFSLAADRGRCVACDLLCPRPRLPLPPGALPKKSILRLFSCRFNALNLAILPSILTLWAKLPLGEGTPYLPSSKGERNRLTHGIAKQWRVRLKRLG